MKFSIAAAAVASAFMAKETLGQNTMVKMCLFYPNASGHARSDPIINQQCSSGHVHTFYGPQNFHPNTSYEDLRDTPAQFSSSPWAENQSLYWHPSIYRVTDNSDGTKTYTRVSTLDSSPYYRWDNTVLPRTEAFPPGFRMIAHSNDPGAQQGGESGANMLTECCDFTANGDEDCVSWDRLEFPTRTCDFLGIAMAMPTCWDGKSLGDDNDHKSHMAYTLDGNVGGECPSGFNHRVPEVQLFVRINNYEGGTYQLSDSSDVWHVDFFNGWQEGKLQEIVDNCELDSSEDYGYNPPCACTPDQDESNFLTAVEDVAGPVCDVDVRELIIDEATDVVNTLPVGSCEGPPLIPKSWDQITDDLFDCQATPTAPTTSPPVATPTDAPVTPPTDAPVTSPTDAPVTPPTDAPVTSPTDAPVTPPTDAPVKPPTDAPVPNPTQPPITEEDDDDEFEGEMCYDRELAFRRKERKNCDWVAKRPNRRCGKTWRGKALWEYCPVACDVECYDCCEITLFECGESADEICDGVLEECESACEEEADDVEECIETTCEIAVDECHERIERRCMATFESCEAACEE